MRLRARLGEWVRKSLPVDEGRVNRCPHKVPETVHDEGSPFVICSRCGKKLPTQEPQWQLLRSSPHPEQSHPWTGRPDDTDPDLGVGHGVDRREHLCRRLDRPPRTRKPDRVELACSDLLPLVLEVEGGPMTTEEARNRLANHVISRVVWRGSAGAKPILRSRRNEAFICRLALRSWLGVGTGPMRPPSERNPE